MTNTILWLLIAVILIYLLRHLIFWVMVGLLVAALKLIDITSP